MPYGAITQLTNEHEEETVRRDIVRVIRGRDPMVVRNRPILLVRCQMSQRWQKDESRRIRHRPIGI